MPADPEEVELIGGPKDGKKYKVMPADRFLKVPVVNTNVNSFDNNIDPEPTLYYDIALYMRNLLIPEFFNFVRMESENGKVYKIGEDSAELGKLDE